MNVPPTTSLPVVSGAPAPSPRWRASAARRAHAGGHVVVGVWLFAALTVACVHPFVPMARWLMVHLLLLGAVSSAVLIWSRHFTVTLLRVPERGVIPLAWRLVGMNAGALTLITGLLAGRPPVILAGGTLVAATALGHGIGLARTARRALATRFVIVVRYYVAAATALALGAVLGLVLALGDLDGDSEARVRLAHEAANLLGWLGVSIVGTLVTLWPTMLRTRMGEHGVRSAGRAVPWLLGGVAGIVVAALLAPPPVAVVGLAGYGVGLARAAVPLVEVARRRPPAGVATWSVSAAAGWLVVSLGILAGVLLTSPTWARVGPGLGVLTAPLVVGWVAQTLFGALSYLVPVLVGGGPRIARATGAIVERGGAARVTATNLALGVAVLPVPTVVRVICSLVVLVLLVVHPWLLVRAVLAGRTLRRGGTLRGAPVAPRDPRAPGASVRAGAGVGLAVVVLAVVLGAALEPDTLSAPVSGSQAQSQVPATGRTTRVAVTALTMRFSPDRLAVPAGDRLVITLRNADTDRHDLVMANGARTPRVPPGGEATLDVGVVGTGLEGWCSVLGHRQMGMVLTVDAVGTGGRAVPPGQVAPPGQAAPSGQAAPPGRAAPPVRPDPPAGGAHTGHGGAGGAFDPMATPAAGFVARDARLAPAPRGGSATVHRRTLTVREVVREVAPGVRQQAWTFDGTVPGPALRGRVGDTFEITLVNAGSMGHSVDFHAGALDPGPVMRTIAPGESLVYRFTATRSGVWMYHCSTMPMSLHIANGMFGAVVIDPPGLPPVDREYLLVQSEAYLGDQEGIADVEALREERPDAVVFNGYVGQYAARPLAAAPGERVRIWALAAGPNRGTTFHVVGAQFDTVFVEGSYRLRPGEATSGGAQVLDLGPAAGGFVELTFPESGTYPFVSHRMIDAERGARGAFRVGTGP